MEPCRRAFELLARHHVVRDIRNEARLRAELPCEAPRDQRPVGAREPHGVIVARNEAAGRALAQNLGYEWRAELGDLRPRMLINVTPIGMTGGAEADALAFEADAVDKAETVFDVVAIPAETPLIVRGRAKGKRVITGLEVIAIQALEQFVLYTGIRPTQEQFEKAVVFARS